MRFDRYKNNPIIHGGMMAADIGNNINGATLMKVPDWVSNPLAKYYLYFGHHRGLYIRMAYANDILGPYTIYDGGVLHLDEVNRITPVEKHIASPEIYIDHEAKKIKMYFHAPNTITETQDTYLAQSDDGLHFDMATPKSLGSFYFRVFEHNGCIYSFGKSKPRDCAELMRSPDGVEPFEFIKDLIPRARHFGFYKKDSTLHMFYTLVKDAPESIFYSTMDLTPPCEQWVVTDKKFVARPEELYEGTNYPIECSKHGPKIGVQQLRDPFIYEEDGKFYMFYSGGGEENICVAEFEF